MWLDWLRDNLAVASAVVVPLLLGILRPILERDREAGGRSARRLKQHAAILGSLPSGSEAAAKMDSLVSAQIAGYEQRLGRKLDGGTLAAILLVSIVGGAVSFGLTTWAQAVRGPGAVVLWVVTAAWTLFVLLLVFVGGGSSLYDTPEDSARRSRERAERKAARARSRAERRSQRPVAPGRAERS